MEILHLRICQENTKALFSCVSWFSLCMQDYDFVLKGLARLLTNPLTQTYLPNSTKKIQFHQELLVLFWKLCDFNKVRDWVLQYSQLQNMLVNNSHIIPAFSLTEIPVLCAEEQ